MSKDNDKIPDLDFDKSRDPDYIMDIVRRRTYIMGQGASGGYPRKLVLRIGFFILGVMAMGGAVGGMTGLVKELADYFEMGSLLALSPYLIGFLFLFIFGLFLVINSFRRNTSRKQ